MKEHEPTRFLEEQKNLEIVKRLKDPHIVKIINAYRHGDAFNLVFARAKTNLDHYLRDSCYGAPDVLGNSPETNPLWDQILGVAKALNRIIHYSPSGESGGSVLYGYHFDLKPANILVEATGRLLISDFGQATFRNASGSSGVTGMGGTPAYAPPETDSDCLKPNRKYDIWSLGCIMLEVCTFTVKGFVGVRDLDKQRLSHTKGSKVEDDRIFRIKPGLSHTYEVKPQIKEWMKQLANSGRLNKHSRLFIQDIMFLVKDMLAVNVNERLDSAEVYQRLETVLNRFRPVRLGEELTRKMQRVTCNTLSGESRQFEEPMLFFENSSKYLTIGSDNDGPSRELPIGFRRHTKLILKYASYGNKYNLLFLTSDSDERANIESHDRVTALSFSNSADVIYTQAILLGQDIRHSFNILGGEIQRRSPLKRILTFHGSSCVENLGSAALVQLWSEESYKDPNAWRICQRKNSPRTVSEFFLYGALPRRIVVYYQRSILIIRLAKNVRLEKPTTTTTPTTWRLIPTNKTRDSTFVASVIRCPDGNAALPLDKSELDAEEQKGQFECTFVTLMFSNEHDSKAFHKAYQVLKAEWQLQDKQVQELKKSMGERVGWAPD